MENINFGIKDIYSAVIKTNQDLDFLGKHYETGETLLHLTNIQDFSLEEDLAYVSATGGYNNKNLVDWNITKEVPGVIGVGTINFISFGLNNLNNPIINQNKIIPYFEKGTTDEEGNFVLQNNPSNLKKVYVYKINNTDTEKEKINFSVSENKITVEEPFIDIAVDYYFEYKNDSIHVDIGDKNLFSNLSFTGKFYYTDKYSGLKKTGIISIPSFKITNNFSIGLGMRASLSLNNIYFTALPTGVRPNQKSLSVVYLDKDIG